jgi:hypothetical protein
LRIGAEPGFDAQFGSGAEHVERQVASGELHAKTLRGRILDVEPQHQERRRVRLLAGANGETSGLRRRHHLPGNRLIAIEAGQRGEILLEKRDVDGNVQVTARARGGRFRHRPAPRRPAGGRLAAGRRAGGGLRGR